MATSSRVDSQSAPECVDRRLTALNDVNTLSPFEEFKLSTVMAQESAEKRTLLKTWLLTDDGFKEMAKKISEMEAEENRQQSVILAEFLKVLVEDEDVTSKVKFGVKMLLQIRHLLSDTRAFTAGFVDQYSSEWRTYQLIMLSEEIESSLETAQLVESGEATRHHYRSIYLDGLSNTRKSVWLTIIMKGYEPNPKNQAWLLYALFGPINEATGKIKWGCPAWENDIIDVLSEQLRGISSVLREVLQFDNLTAVLPNVEWTLRILLGFIETHWSHIAVHVVVLMAGCRTMEVFLTDRLQQKGADVFISSVKLMTEILLVLEDDGVTFGDAVGKVLSKIKEGRQEVLERLVRKMTELVSGVGPNMPRSMFDMMTKMSCQWMKQLFLDRFCGSEEE